MTVPTTSWDETSPAGSDNINQGDNRIREFKTQFRELFNVDHNFASSGQNADYGKHNKVSLMEQADLGTGAAGKPILGAQTVSGKAELVFTDEDDNDIQITDNGVLRLASARIANDTYIVGRNNAGAGNINIIKVNTSDELVLGAVTTLPDTSKLATSDAPTADAQIANKKYVDDQVAALELVKAWAKFNGTGTAALSDSFNVSSFADNGTGSYTLTWDTDFANTNYAVVASVAGTGDGSIAQNASPKTWAVGSIIIETKPCNSTSLADRDEVSVIAFGDQ